ncbi:AraC family transcriptional regulator [Oceanicoccus sp. KOV_DT_Chl]|uniref:helix-turn-helix domain-containing protein n=1 Tax=Oceanicoccus sp. KOV_DT_Chl TaxID=1904639 RepID=UPI000C7D8073|nr:helix-turn-helix domain-containing protein [Oceanicoccus sp. KOV_DT_Chl]
MALRLLPSYELLIRNQYSSIEAITLQWLHRIIVFAAACYSVLLAIDLLIVLIPDIGFKPRRVVQYINDISLFYLFGLAGFRHGLLFNNRQINTAMASPVTAVESEVFPVESIKATAKYGKSSLTAELNAEILALVDQYMLKQQPYTDSGMQLSDLADAINLSTHEISQAINTSGSNFYDYVNGYRAHKARELLESDRYHYLATQDIAVEAGFASKSTFYKYFKKHYNFTPAQYRKNFSQATENAVPITTNS